MGRALMGPPRALMGRAVMGRALMGPLGPYGPGLEFNQFCSFSKLVCLVDLVHQTDEKLIYLCIYIYIYIYTVSGQ